MESMWRSRAILFLLHQKRICALKHQVNPSLIKLRKISKDKRQEVSHINLNFIKLSLKKNNEKFHLCQPTLWENVLKRFST